MAKPRKPLRDTANGRLVDDAIHRTALVARYGEGRVRSVVGWLNDDVFPDLVARLQWRLDRIRLRGADSGAWTTQRYRDMLGDTYAILRDAAKEGRLRMATDLRAFAKREATWQLRAFHEATPGVKLELRGLNLNAAQAVASQPIHGQPLSKWWGKLASDTQARITQQVGIGVTTGETTDQIVRRIQGTQAQRYRDGILQTTRAQTAAVVQTAVAHVSTQARLQTAKENADIIKGMRWGATLDQRTCLICGPLDGKVFPVDSQKAPPLHPNCRCVLSSVVKSWRELGINIDDAPAGTRASMDGQVPSTTTYAEWIAQQSPERQNDALGASRAKLYRAGKFELGDFTTKTGRTLTLEELDR